MNDEPLKQDRVIPLLILCALGAIAFTCLGGVLVYNNTQRVSEIGDWLDHSHNILTTLQMQSQRLERMNYGVQLYQATGSNTELRLAQSSAISMHADVLNLESLVRDNPEQMRHIRELDGKLNELSRALNATTLSGNTIDQRIQDCRRVVNEIQQEETDLLRQRTDARQKGRVLTVLSGAGFLGCSLVIVVALFGFLLRDAFRRHSFERQISIANDQLAATIKELEQRGREAALLKEARDELQLCVTLQEAEECTVRHFQELVPGSRGAILLTNDSRSLTESAATWNHPDSLLDAFDVDACCGLRAGRPRWRKPGQSELHCSHFLGTPPENYLCIPLVAQGETLGFVYLEFPTNEIASVAEKRISLVEEMVELSSMAFASLNLHAKLASQSIRDGLTGLFNRHFMEVAFERELHRALRRHAQLAVMMLDVDHFKSFNDTFGHEAGDIVLRSVAQSFQQSVRSEDIVCRYGGEEFIIILPEISEKLALERADTIRRNIHGLRMKLNGETQLSVTVSIGVAMYPTPARDAANLVRLADQALYEAKRAGRDRVYLAQDSSHSQDATELLLPAVSFGEGAKA